MTTSSFLRLLPLLFTFVFFTICPSLLAQQTQYDRGTPPQHAAGVSSLGSYSSADVGTVNLSNGALNLKFSLGTVGGRGFSLPLTLNWSSKLWSASTDTDEDRDGSKKNVVYADFARGDDPMGFMLLGPGWTIGAAPTISVQIVRINPLTSGPNVGCYTYTVPKLTVILPDKGEIEFRDDAYNGMPLASDCSGYVSASRGMRWHATDGSGAVFKNSVDNGVAGFNTSGEVITADGMRYHFSYSLCDSITDRNGNKITFELIGTGLKITDQLGRITKVEQNVPDPQNTSVTLPLLVTLPGYNGQSRYYKLKTGIMNQYYRSDINPTLPVVSGDYDPLSYGYRWTTATRLFRFSYGLYQQRIDLVEEPTELILPDNRSLRFRYNEYGEVAELQMPAGGKVWYDYDYSSTPAGNSPFWETSGDLHTTVDVDRVLYQRRTFPDGANLECTWSYSYGGSAEVTATAADGTLMLDEVHYFLPAGRYYTYIPSGSLTGTHNTLWSTGVEYRVENRNAAGVVIGAREQDWTQRAPLSWPSYPQEQPPNDNRVNQSRRYLETGMMSKVETSYDQYNNPIEVKEYDFDQTLRRRTTTSYLNSNLGFNYQTDDAIHLLSLPATQTIYDGNNNQVARTVTEYDVYTDDTNHYWLTDYGSNVSQHDTAYNASKVTRGNPTRIGQWLNTTGSYIYSYPRYDTLGNVISMKDARGYVSTISFADDFGLGSNPGVSSQNPATPTYALPTLITSPPPQAGASPHTARSQYDFATGLLTGFRDRNNVVTQTIYNDPFNRPTQANSALNITGVENRTLIYYAPATTPFGITLANNDVLTAKDQTTLNDNNLRSWTVTDGFGRTKEAWNRDPQGDVKVTTIYDALGRVKQVSNPFRSGETEDFTLTTYDFLGRITAVKTPDQAIVSTTYNANTVTVTDQAGKTRKSVTDALGRLVQVVEDPGDSPKLNYQTTYTYDTLDNLVKVTQGTQQRFFMYDSLKRLIRARNPEQGTKDTLDLSDPITGNSTWSMAYEYDVANNLTKKTDARGVYSTYAYDALNRNTEINYSDTTTITPDIKRFYDGATKGVGRLWYALKGDESLANNVEKTTIDSYDELGRPLAQQQSFKLNGVWKSYPISRTYNLAGGVLTQTYPSPNRSVSYGYDSAGRTATFSGNLGGDQRTYATDITYSSWGSIGREKFGTNSALYHKAFYNIRGQLFDTRLSSVNDTWDWNRGRLINYYSSNHVWGQSGTDNNGNVLFAETWIPPEGATLDQADTLWEDAYSYDALNRLTSVAEQKKSVVGGVWQPWTQQFRQQYTYDQYGNRTIDAAQTWGTGINNKQFVPNVNNKNQLGVPSGQSGTMTYDAAGNLTTDTYTGAGAREYDAENKMTRAWGGNNQWQEYTYNADGQRTRRKVDGQETWQIYGLDGELLAEYAADASLSTPQKEYGYRNGQLLITASPGSGDQSLNLNGTGAYVQVPNSSSLNISGAITVEAWIKVNAITGAYQDIISRESWNQAGTGGGFELSVTNSGKLRLDTYQSPTAYTPLVGGITITAGVWHHVAAVFDGSQIRLYVDGVLDTSLSTTNGPASGTSSLKIGRASYAGTYFGGLIDEARVSNSAVYTSNFTPSTHLTASGSTKGLWKFDGQSPSDSSGNANNGSLQSSATFSADVPTGPTTSYYSGSFNGTGAYVQVSNSSSLNISGAITVEAWIKVNAITGAYQDIISRESWNQAGTGGGFELSVTNSGKLRLDTYQSPTAYTPLVGGITITAGVWHHVAAVFDGSQIRLYVDGVLDTSLSTTNGPASGTSSLKIGRASYAGTYFGGLIDEARVSNSAVYTSNFTPSTHLTASGSTKGLWKFDGQSPSDSSGNANNGLLQGATYSTDVPSGDGGGSGSSTSSSAQVQWLVSDQLGTPRTIVDQTGSLANLKRHDYLPFGEELFAPAGGRSVAQGYASGDGIRQQFTSKERDLETGLDYFGARDFSSTQGRFTSTDPVLIQEEMLSDPQRFNLYGYVRNTPLTLIDPTGEAIELTGDEKERAKKLELLRKTVGNEAGAYLYENKAKDGKYYVGIYTNGPDGKGKDFGSLNASAGNLVGIIRDSLVAEINLVAPGTYEEVGTIESGKSPGATGVDENGRARIFLLDPSKAPGYLPAELTSNGEPLAMETSDVLAHELGHVASQWGLAAGSAEGVAISFENDARKVRNPNTPTRESYKTKGDLKTSKYPFLIPFRKWPR